MKKALALLLFSFVLILAGCSESATNKVVEPVLDVEQFSLVSKAIVKDKLGEPESVEDFNYKTPSTGANNLLTYYNYDWLGFDSDFIFDDKDRLVRINIYEGENENSKFKKTTFEDLLKQLNVAPGENLTKVADNGLAWRYERVSEKIDEIWTVGDTKEVGVIKISFDSRPFK